MLLPNPARWTGRQLAYSLLSQIYGMHTQSLATGGTTESVLTADRTGIPRRRRPVDVYLHGQGRYQHLFEPTRNAAMIQHIQAQVDRYWTEVCGA